MVMTFKSQGHVTLVKVKFIDIESCRGRHDASLCKMLSKSVLSYSNGYET